MLAEQNLAIAAQQRDFPRVTLVNDLLWNLTRERPDQGGSRNPCLEALDALTAAAIASAFSIHSVVTDDPANRFSKEMRPTDETLRKWFSEGSSIYRDTIGLCEADIRHPATQRVLPETVPLVP